MAKHDSNEESIEVTCPECGAIVRVPIEEAEREMRARCPNGHDVELAKML
ncbi:MAG: hypothetical protein FWD69_07165 [Polyangiaceae bacterium]|nr:hypothetical protein [Polyangiaceae bacterium]